MGVLLEEESNPALMTVCAANASEVGIEKAMAGRLGGNAKRPEEEW